MLLWLKTWYIGSVQTPELWNTSLQLSDFRLNLSSQQAPIYIIFKHELFHLHSNLQLPRLNSISSPACAVKIQSSSLAQYPVRTLSSMILWGKRNLHHFFLINKWVTLTGSFGCLVPSMLDKGERDSCLTPCLVFMLHSFTPNSQSKNQEKWDIVQKIDVLILGVRRNS